MELPAVYGHASALVYPSRYEGFGLPILEAMAARCPTLLAEQRCFREVAADASAFFPVGDAEFLAGVIRDVVRDQTYRSSLVRAGLDRVTEFSWTKTAQATLDVYRSLTS